MSPEILLPILRHVLQLVAGYLMAQGFLPEGGTELLIGAGLSVFSFVWWLVGALKKKSGATR